MDPIPKQTIDKNSENTLPSKIFAEANDRHYLSLLSNSESYALLSEAEKAKADNELVELIENEYEEKGDQTLVDALVMLRDHGNHDPDYSIFTATSEEVRPTDRLQITDINSVMSPEQFLRLPERTRAMYMLSVRATAMAKLLSSSSYESGLVYGVLPHEVLEAEARTYNALVDEYAPGLIERIEAANEVNPIIANVPRIEVNERKIGLLLPGDVTSLVGRAGAEGLENDESAKGYLEARNHIAYRYLGDALQSLLDASDVA